MSVTSVTNITNRETNTERRRDPETSPRAQHVGQGEACRGRQWGRHAKFPPGAGLRVWRQRLRPRGQRRWRQRKSRAATGAPGGLASAGETGDTRAVHGDGCDGPERWGSGGRGRSGRGLSADEVVAGEWGGGGRLEYVGRETHYGGGGEGEWCVEVAYASSSSRSRPRRLKLMNLARLEGSAVVSRVTCHVSRAAFLSPFVSLNSAPFRVAFCGELSGVALLCGTHESETNGTDALTDTGAHQHITYDI